MPNQIIYNGEKYSGNYPTDLAENVVSFEFADESNPTSFQEMPPFTTPGRMKTLMHNLSIAYKNLRYLVKLFGTTDISAIGDGTVSGILDQLNENTIKPGQTLSFTAFAPALAVDENILYCIVQFPAYLPKKNYTCKISNLNVDGRGYIEDANITHTKYETLIHIVIRTNMQYGLVRLTSMNIEIKIT